MVQPYRWPSLASFQATQLALELNLKPSKVGWTQLSQPLMFPRHLIQPNGPAGPG